MKTRIMILACLLAVPAGRMAAQQQTDPEQKATVQTQGDSIIIRKGKGDMRIKVYEEQLEDGEKKEVQIYEGVYLEKVDADKRTFLDALPFIPKKRRYNAYEPHCSGLYIGYSRLANDFLSFGASDKMGLDLSKSWEFGFNILSVYHNFKKNPHWGINLLMEWQQRVGRNKVFFNAGPEFEIRHSVKSFSHINGGKKKTVGKGMYVQPVGINLLAQAGYGNIGIYLRYSTYGLFQKDKGPEVSPYSFGVAWYL